MASNVFGIPITDQSVRAMPSAYKDKVITRKDRAHVALNMKNAGNKDVSARTYVEQLNAQFGGGVCTLCLIYNATGDTVTYVLAKDWHGHIGAAPYPPQIANGQWGVFLHVQPAIVHDGSMACVVYRGKNDGGYDCDWMLGWCNPWSTLGSHNHAYTEIRQARHYQESLNSTSN